jgi:hypothetical protein
MVGKLARGAVQSHLRAIAAVAVLGALSVSPAQAQSWREYRYSGFAVQFPVEPKSESGTYATDEGTTVNVRIYSARQESALYKVTVADLSELSVDQAQEVSDGMIGQLAAGREVVVDVPHRVNRVLGRQLSIVGDDGRRSAVALFFRDRRLYVVEGTTLPANGDTMSADGVRFQQSLRFIVNNARGDFVSEFYQFRPPRNPVDGNR